MTTIIVAFQILRTYPKIETALFCETSVYFEEHTGRHISEHRNINITFVIKLSILYTLRGGYFMQRP